MRISTGMIYSMMKHDLNRTMQSLVDAQEPVTSMKKVNNISDDPINAGRIFEIDSTMKKYDQFQRNIGQADSWASLQDTTLTDVNDAIGRIKELALSQAGSSGTTDDTRRAAALEIISLRDQILNSANTRLGNSYIFAGMDTNSKPFESYHFDFVPDAGNTGNPTITAEVASPYTYNNNNYRIVFTAANTFDIINTTLGVTTLAGQTYTPGSKISFDGIEMQITNTPSAPANGDAWNINIAKPGTYNGDSGKIKLELEEGNTVQINMPGDTVFQGAGIPGGLNIFTVVNDLVDGLRSADHTAIQDSLDNLDNSSKQVLSNLAGVGARQNLFDDIGKRLDDMKYTFQVLQANYQEVDLVAATTDLSQAELAYNAALGAAAKMGRTSLMDFLTG